MRYYIDNFRGLQNQIIDLKKVNFLVGENSTGKSSLMKAISLISNFNFWMNGDLFSEDFELGKNERYYPIPNDENTKLYNKYLEKSKMLKNVYFLGRLGDYKYYDMDKAILRALELFEEIK